MNNQFLSLKFSKNMPENKAFDIKVYINDTILCCHWMGNIPDNKILTCDLNYECLNFLFFLL